LVVCFESSRVPSKLQKLKRTIKAGYGTRRKTWPTPRLQVPNRFEIASIGGV